jgi:hypothetical protein
VAEPVFTGPVLGAVRPRWSPHDDPRLEALAAGFALLLEADIGADVALVVVVHEVGDTGGGVREG